MRYNKIWKEQTIMVTKRYETTSNGKDVYEEVNTAPISKTNKFQFHRNFLQWQPPTDVLRKRRSEIMQQIYWRTPMSKCDINKVAKHLHSSK